MLFATLAGHLSARRLIPVLSSNHVYCILGVLDCVLGCGMIAMVALVVLSKEETMQKYFHELGVHKGGDCSDVACGRKWEMGNSLLGQSCKLNENE